MDAKRAFGQTAGSYYLCFYAYTSFSARVSVAEQSLGIYFAANDNQIQTVYLQGGSYFVARYANTGFNNGGNVKIWVEGQGLAAGEAPPEVYYAVCGDSDPAKCVIDDDILAGGSMCVLGDKEE